MVQFVITFLNVALFVFVVPEWILDAKRISLLTKVFPAVIVAGLFGLVVVWFKNVLTTLPEKTWFQTINFILFVLLVLLNISQQNISAVFPQIKSNGYQVKVLVDDTERAYQPGGTIRLSIADHTVRIVPEIDENQSKDSQDASPQIKEGKFTVSYKDVLGGLFADYKPQWGLLYVVGINVLEPNVEVLIHKTDGDFDVAFIADPPPTAIKNPFSAKPGSQTDFVYRGSDTAGGTFDRFYLPYGVYEFTASRADCLEKPQLTRTIGEDRGRHIINFAPLCQAHH